MSVITKLEIQVDASKCLAYGTCVGLAPDHFDLPSNARVVQVLKREISENEVEEVEEAVRNCPARALAIRQADV